MSTPPVTWILPVRNAEQTLEETLASIASQDYARHTVLAWDDGSTDTTADILDRWLGKKIPGRTLSHDRIGLGKALGYLVGSAKTELLARIDGDDTCNPDRLAQQVQFMSAHRKVAVLGTQMSAMGDSTEKMNQPFEDADIRWALRVRNPINHPTVMLRRSAVLEAGNYRDIRPGQDYDLWVRMAMLFRFSNLPQSLVSYRIHDKSVSQQGRSDNGESFYRLRDARIDRLLPGVEPEAAHRLLRLIQNPDDLSVSADDLVRFRRAAMLAAQACRYRPTLFTETDLFKKQYANLRIRHLKRRPVLRAAWPLLKTAKAVVKHLPIQGKRHAHRDQVA